MTAMRRVGWSPRISGGASMRGDGLGAMDVGRSAECRWRRDRMMSRRIFSSTRRGVFDASLEKEEARWVSSGRPQPAAAKGRGCCIGSFHPCLTEVEAITVRSSHLTISRG